MSYKQIVISVAILIFLIQSGCAGNKTSFQEATPVKNQETPTVKNAEVPAKQSDLPDYEQIKKKIVDITARQLSVESKELNADAPLSKQKTAADELDVIEIVMTVEETFNVEIKDSELGGNVVNISNVVSVKKLADIVFENKETKEIKALQTYFERLKLSNLNRKRHEA